MKLNGGKKRRGKIEAALFQSMVCASPPSLLARTHTLPPPVCRALPRTDTQILLRRRRWRDRRGRGTGDAGRAAAGGRDRCTSDGGRALAWEQAALRLRPVPRPCDMSPAFRLAGQPRAPQAPPPDVERAWRWYRPAPLLQNETNARLNLQTPACVWSIYSNRFCIAKA
jgi:hypothetical protein